MYLQNLQLYNFKNYEEANLVFTSRINVLVGKNGSGKTNVLDAIYYLSFTKSAFTTSDLQCIRHGQGNFLVKGKYRMGEALAEVASAMQTGTKKIFRENQQDYSKLSEHIGKYPVVLIAPDDVDLVKEGGEARRKFFDSIISQLDTTYLESLIQYNHILKQRNSLLRMFQEKGKVDELALDSYDHMLVNFGEYLYKRRSEFIIEFNPVFHRYFQFIVQEAESTSIQYNSTLWDRGFLVGLQESRQKDIFLQRTSFGIHRDDYQFSLGEGDLKRLGSQGQQKSFVIALKLAQYEIMENYKGFKPILLLDDIFDKLDDYRISRLLELIKSNLGQLFITDARPDRTNKLLEQVSLKASVYRIEDGLISPYE